MFDPVPETGGIRTMAADPARLEDPSLIIYNPVRALGNAHIVTNGDQTDTVYEFMSGGGTFEEPLRTRTLSRTARTGPPHQRPGGAGRRRLPLQALDPEKRRRQRRSCRRYFTSTRSRWRAKGISFTPTAATAAPSQL